MKSISILLVTFLIVSVTSAQSTVTLTGTISHPTSSMVYVKYYQDYLTYAEVVADSAKLDKNGNFSMHFTWEHPYPATFYHGEEITEMYLSPGDQLKLTLDTKQFDETVKYEGKGANVNNYLASKTLRFPSDPTIFKLPEKDFVRTIDSIHVAEMKYFFESFVNTSNLDLSIMAFKTNEQNEINYSWAEQRLSYPSYYQYLNQLKSPTQVSAGYYDFYSTIHPYNPDAIHSSAYQEFFSEYIDHEIRETFKKDTTQLFFNVMDQFIGEKLTGQLQEFILAQWVYNTITEKNDIKQGELIFEKLKSNFPNSEYMNLLNSTIAVAGKLQPGNPAPIFTFPDVEGKMVSLTDFKGKVVYLDIWASWCGPCRGEIPSARKLEENMKDQDVVFLCVSVDEDEKAWKKIIKDKELKGIHLISKGNFESEIAHLYNVRGIPHYVIIGRDGNIVDYNAKRPSEAVEEDLEKLLEN